MEQHSPYEKLFGFVPELTKKRHDFTKEVSPDQLEVQEEFRKSMMHSSVLDDRTGQLVLFGILSSHLREGARVHAIAARRLGVSWAELHAVSNLVFLFSGLSAMNFSINILAGLKEKEAAGHEQ